MPIIIRQIAYSMRGPLPSFFLYQKQQTRTKAIIFFVPKKTDEGNKQSSYNTDGILANDQWNANIHAQNLYVISKKL